MAYLNEQTKFEISKKKLNVLQSGVDGLDSKIDSIVSLGEGTYEVLEVKWRQLVRQVKAVLNDSNYFLFIGRFSAGKSSFINKLIGTDILPTASVPCTAVVTEVRFVNGGPTDGKVVYQGGYEETVLQADIRDMIIGKKMVENGSIHHLELYLDINLFGDEKDRFVSLVDKVVLVDCPGFDSPYRFSEDILYEYIDKASFTFYMLPANDFGGFKEVSRLSMLRKKTATLIPIISKADLIEDDEAREDIIDQFRNSLSNSFGSEDPIFVSSYRYNEFLERQSECKDKILMGTITAEEQDTINKLYLASGISYVVNQLASKSKDSELNEKKVTSVLSDFNDVVTSLRKAAINEENKWRKKLLELGYDLDNDKYTLLVQKKTTIDNYINDQTHKAGQELKNKIVSGLVSINPKSTSKTKDVNEICTNAAKEIMEKYAPIWREQFKVYYEGQNVEFLQTIGEDFKPSDTDFPSPLNYIPMGILDGIKKAGIQSISMAAVGGALFASKAAIAGLALVGGPLSALAMIVGGAAFGYAGVSALPSIKDALDDRKHQNEQEIAKRIRDMIDGDVKLDCEQAIRTCLITYRDNIEESFKGSKATDKENYKRNYEDSINIKNELAKIQADLNLQVGD